MDAISEKDATELQCRHKGAQHIDHHQPITEAGFVFSVTFSSHNFVLGFNFVFDQLNLFSAKFVFSAKAETQNQFQPMALS